MQPLHLILPFNTLVERRRRYLPISLPFLALDLIRKAGIVSQAIIGCQRTSYCVDIRTEDF